MSSSEKENRVNALLAKAKEEAQNDRLREASQILREASHIHPEHAGVKEAWSKLQLREDGEDFLQLLKEYLANGTESDGQKALQVLERKPLTPHDAAEGIELLLSPTSKASLRTSLLTTLLSHQKEARKFVTSQLASRPNDIFERLFNAGDDAFGSLVPITADDSLWMTKAAQNKAQQDVFRLSIATLMEAGAEDPERAMKALARQLSLYADNLVGLADEDAFDVSLTSLDIRLARGLRSQALLVTSKLLETTQEQGQELFSRFITEKVSQQTNEDLILAFSAAAAVFPIIPAVAAKLFLTEGFVQQLVPNLEKNSEAAASGKRKSNTLEQAALELLSSASVDKACRESINRYCSHWLKNLAEEREGTNKALAALVLAKVIGDTAGEDVTEKLSQLVLKQKPDESNAAIEGLAYTSLQPKIREEIVQNEQLVRALVSALNEQPAVQFGCLTTFSNLTAYRPVRSEEQKKMAQLKAYANSSRPAAENALENDDKVTQRCRKVLDADLVPALVSCCKQATSLTNIALVVRIMQSLAKDGKHRSKMAQQGAVRTLLQIRERMAKSDRTSSEGSMIERQAAHTLARLLISVNPMHVFTAALPASSAVSAIIQLLTLDQESEERDLLPTFEALLALTNLASMDDSAPRDLIIRVAWTTLENQLLLSNNALVQRASVELVCNLMASPSGVAKFADGSKAAGNRMHILLALADADDLATRKAAGGALAMLTEWDAAVSAVLDKERGIRILLGLCVDEHDELKHRGLVCLLNAISAPEPIGSQALVKAKAEGGQELIAQNLRNVKNPEVLAIGVEILKKLQ